MTDKFSTINMTDIEFYNIQKEDLSDALTNYILILCYNYAVAGIVGFNHRREPYIDFVCEHLCIRANKKSYGISLHYGCDDFSINEFVEIFKNEIEFLHTVITATQEKAIPSPGSSSMIYFMFDVSGKLFLENSFNTSPCLLVGLLSNITNSISFNKCP